MANSIVNEKGITINQLKEFLDKFDADDESEVWVMTGPCVSSTVTEICRLNSSDIVLSPSIYNEEN